MGGVGKLPEPVTIVSIGGVPIPAGGGVPVTPAPASGSSSSGVASPATGGVVLVPNPAGRLAWSIQNLGTNPLFVKRGAGATTSSFDFVLKACTAQDDGSGGFYTDDLYKGVVSVAGTSPRCVVSELTGP